MQKIESAKDLEDWPSYTAYMRDSLKLVDAGSPAFISKKKVNFKVDGSVWKGHAFLAGEKALRVVQALKKDGILFKEGRCDRKGKDLDLVGFELPLLIKQARKTSIKLKLGYKIHAPDVPDSEGEGEDADSAAATTGATEQQPDARALDEFKRIKARLAGPIKDALNSNGPAKSVVATGLRKALALEKSQDWSAATLEYAAIERALAGAATGSASTSKLTQDRRKTIVADLGKMERDLDKLLAALG